VCYLTVGSSRQAVRTPDQPTPEPIRRA
jgi:hypothetical protein